MDNAADAFSGEGGVLFSGRWHSKGTRIVYCAESISLCVLESLVHYDIDLSPPLYLYEYEVEISDLLKLKSPQKYLVDKSLSAQEGDNFIKTNSCVGLIVPSVIVNEETNVLINPTNPAFDLGNVKSHGEYNIDSRLMNK